MYSRYAEPRSLCAMGDNTYSLSLSSRDILDEEPMGNVIDAIRRVACVGGPEFGIGQPFDLDRGKRRVRRIVRDWSQCSAEHARYIITVEVSNGEHKPWINNKKMTQDGRRNEHSR